MANNFVISPNSRKNNLNTNVEGKDASRFLDINSNRKPKVGSTYSKRLKSEALDNGPKLRKKALYWPERN